MTENTAYRLRLYLSLVGGVVILGTAAILVRLAHAPGVVTAFYRTATASVVLFFPFLVNRKRNPQPACGRKAWIAVAGGSIFAINLGLWSSGVVLGGATNPTLMINTAPLWVGLGSMLFFHERGTRQFWAGLCLAMVGVVIVLGQDLSLALNFGLGSFMGLLAAVFYGSFFLISQIGRSYLDALSYTWISTTSMALLLLLTSLVLGLPLSGFTALTWLAFLASGLIVQVAGWLLLNSVQGRLPASIVSPTVLLQPVVTALIAIPLFGERFTPWHILGGTAVLTGIYLVHRSKYSAQKVPL